MITVNEKEEVKFDIDVEELAHSIALLMDMHDYYMEEQTEEDVSDTVAALHCAVETMLAFACEHFDFEAEGEDVDR